MGAFNGNRVKNLLRPHAVSTAIISITSTNDLERKAGSPSPLQPGDASAPPGTSSNPMTLQHSLVPPNCLVYNLVLNCLHVSLPSEGYLVVILRGDIKEVTQSKFEFRWVSGCMEIL